MNACTRGGIRTHEAEAAALKAAPFDRSGTRVYILEVGFEPTILSESVPKTDVYAVPPLD